MNSGAGAVMSTALMKRPCVALVLVRRRYRRLTRVYTETRVQGHRFLRDLDWCCENCGAKLEPRRRPGARVRFGHPEDWVDPCPNPTMSRFEEMLIDYLLDIVHANPTDEEPS